jgi:HEAT repeat protein
VNESQVALEKALDTPGAAVQEVIAASMGLRLLGDPDVVPDLVKRLAATDAKKTEDALAIVNALALLQDPLAGEPLLSLLADESRHEDVRSAIVWCLGLLADPDAPDWTAKYANGVDYTYLPWTLNSPMADGRGLLDWR